MTFVTNQQALLQDLSAHPEDVVLRGIYADLLEEQGDWVGALYHRSVAQYPHARWGTEAEFRSEKEEQKSVRRSKRNISPNKKQSKNKTANEPRNSVWCGNIWD